MCAFRIVGEGTRPTQTALGFSPARGESARNDSLGLRAARWVLIVLVPLVTWFFLPLLDSPFLVPKSALLLAGVGIAFLFTALSAVRIAFLPANIGIWLGAWWAVSCISALLSDHPYFSACTWIFTGLLLAISICTAFAGRENNLLWAISIAAAGLALITILQYTPAFNLFRIFQHDSVAIGRMRFYGTLGNPDFVAAFLAGALPAIFAVAEPGRRSTRYFSVIAVLVVLGAILLAGSRAGALAVIVGGSSYFLLQRRGKSIRLRWLLLFAITGVVLLGLTVNSRSWSETLRGRLFIWKVATTGLRAHPIFGSGPGTFAYFYPERLGQYLAHHPGKELTRFIGYERHAENEFVESAVEVGLFGLLAFLAAMTSWFRRTLQAHSRTPTNAAVAGMAALLTVALFDFPFHRAEMWLLFWIYLALPFCAVPSTRPLRMLAAQRAFTVLIATAIIYFAIPPAFASYYVMQGRESEGTGDTQRAIAAYRRALRFDPRSDAARFNLTRALATAEQYPEALAASYAAERYVNEPELWLLRARIFESQGDISGARSTLVHAISRFPYAEVLQKELAEIGHRE